MKVVACNGNRPLAEAIATALNMPLTNASIRRFADMEVFVEILENVRGEDVFVIQSTSYPANDNLLVVSPDVGGVIRARGAAKRLQVGLAIIDKRREQAGVSEVMNIIGEVRGRCCILIDDIVDSAGTLCNAAVALAEAGAASVIAYVTHGVLSGGAVARVASSALERLVITDTILASEAVRVARNIRCISIAPLMAEAMSRISEERSVSSLFD